VSAAYAPANTVTMPEHQAGDTILVFTFRNGSTIPSLVSGYTSLTTDHRAVGTGNWGARVAYKVAASSSEVVGTWTNATSILVLVYRGVSVISGTYATNKGTTSTTIVYPALTLTGTNQQSWVVRLVGASNVSTTTPDLTTNPLAGYVQRAGSATDILALDTNGPVSSNPTADSQVTTSTTYWYTVTLELQAADSTGSFFALF